MRKFLFLLLIFLLSLSIMAQVPFSFNYQGLARDSEGAPIDNQEISLLMSIISGFENGQIEFQEEHIVTTDEYGLFSIRIGEGDLLLGNLRNIDWGEDMFFLRTEMDPEGGENYIFLGTSQLRSVPYALFAAEAANSSSATDNDTDPTNEIQILGLSGNQLSISGGNSVQLPSPPDVPAQELSLTGKTLSISDGNAVDLSTVSQDADADPTNELQGLSVSGNQLSISGGNSVQLPVSSNTSFQELSLSGKILSISDGNAIDLSPVSQDADADPTNEFQSLSLNGSNLSLSNGNSVNLPEGTSPWETQQGGIGYSGAFAALQNQDGTDAVSLVRFNDGSGGIDLFQGSDRRVELFSNIDDAGTARLNGENGNTNILLSSVIGASNKPWIGTYNENGDNIGAMFISASGRGGLIQNGPNGNRNINLTALGSNVNHGFITVNDVEGESQAGMYIDEDGNGRIFADFVDSFVDNPEKSNQKVRYSVIQGPEDAAYLRGTAQLTAGNGSIQFPKHFQNLIEKEGMTVMITPLSAESKGIAVVKKDNQGFNVRELLQGTGDYLFDWEVKGVRRSFYKANFDAAKPNADPDQMGMELSHPKTKQ